MLRTYYTAGQGVLTMGDRVTVVFPDGHQADGVWNSNSDHIGFPRVELDGEIPSWVKILPGFWMIPVQKTPEPT